MLPRSAILPLLAAATLAPAGAAGAATTIGSVDGTPTAGCSPGAYDCTYTMLDSTLVSPIDGLITSYRVHHGAAGGSDIPSFGLRIFSGGGPTFTSRIATGSDSRLSSGDAIDTFTLDPPVAIRAGERVGLYSSAPSYAVLGAGSGAGEAPGNVGNGSGTFPPRDGLRLLLEVRVEADANGNGIGDDSEAGQAPSGGGNTVTPYYARSIEEFHAETPAIYRAATIKRLPPRTSLYQAVLRGWSQPIRCSLACQITTAATMRGVSGSLLALFSRSVTIAKASARFPSAGRGRIRVRLTRRAARALRRYGRTVRVDYRVIVSDGRKRVVRRQRLTLVARRR